MVIDTSIKKGYKQTELGVIPEDWEVRTFFSAVRIAKGQVDPKVEPYKSMILVAPDHVESGTGRLLDKKTAAEQHAISGKYVFGVGNIVYSKIRPYLHKAILAEFEGLCSADMYPLKPAKDVSAGFMLAIILGQRFSKYAESVSVRSGIPKINRAELAEYIFVLPPLPEQIAIATVLYNTDALIEHLEKLIVKKKGIKQGAMQQLLAGKKRLPGFIGDWEEKKLGEIFFLSSSYSKSKFIDEGGYYLIMDMGSVSSEGQMIASKRTNKSVDLLNVGDLVMPKDDIGGGNIIGKVVLIDRNNKYILGDHVYKLTAKITEVDPRFFSYLINGNTVNSELRKKVSGSAQLGLGRKSIEEQIVKIPKDKLEQTAIATILSDMDAEIENLEQKRDKYTLLKQGMMQQLLTGRIRIYAND